MSNNRDQKPIFDILPPERTPAQKPIEPDTVRETASAYVEPTPTDTSEAEDIFLHKLAQDKKPEAPWHRPRTGTSKWMGAVGALIVLVGAGAWAVSDSFSKANITIVAERAFEPFSFTAVLDIKTTSPDFGAGRLPVQLLSKYKEFSKGYQATGESSVSAYARGKIIVQNNFSSSPQTLIARTRFASPDGKIFRTTGRIIVPGNGSVEVEVIADQPGSAHNIEPTKFTIPGFQGTPRYDKIYGESKQAFRGGATGKTKVVTADDIKKAETDISKLAFDELLGEIKTSIPDEFIFLGQESMQSTILSLVTDARAGDAMADFRVSIKASAKALIFDELQIKELAKRRFVPQDALQRFPSAEFSFAYTKRSADFDKDKERLELIVDSSLNIAKSLDVSQLKRSLAGKNETYVRAELLSIPGINEVKVVLWPVWINKMPNSPDRIGIRVE